jgi:hypothetical protein
VGSPYEQRGAITDETIDIVRTLWTQVDPSHQGKRYQFSGMKFSPKPLQKPHIPLLIGGVSRAAIRRAVRVGNGWHPTALPPEVLRERLTYLEAQAQAAGRSMSDIPVSMSIPMQGGRAGRFTLGQEPKEMVQKLQAFASMGVETVVISPYAGDAQVMTQALEMMARDVIPAFR